MNTLTDEQRTLLSKLASLSEQIEGYRASLFMLERARLQLQTELRRAGYQPPGPESRE